MTRKVQRRDVVKGIGAVGIIGLAGCTEAEDDGETGDDGTDDGETDDDGTDDAAREDPEEEEVDLDPVPDDREIEYGVLMPDTGDLGPLGGPIGDAAELPVEQLDGEVNFEFDVTRGDTQTNPEAGISEANSMVDAGIPAVVGPAASNVNLQVTRQSFIPNQVVGISPSSTAPAVTDLDDDGYIFRTAPSDALQGPVIAEVAMDEFDSPGTVSTMFLNDDYGQALEEAFVGAFEDEHGGEALERVSFEPEQTSYASQLDTAMGADPDFLWIVGFPESGVQIFRDFYDGHDDDFPIIVPDGLIDSTLPEEVGNPMNNVWGTAPAAGGPGADRFAELYENVYGREPGVFNSQAYDAAAIVILANVAAGENDGTAIRDKMAEVANPPGEVITAENLAEGIELRVEGEPIQYQGASSSCEFDGNGDMRAVSYDILRYQDGDIETLRTIDFS